MIREAIEALLRGDELDENLAELSVQAIMEGEANNSQVAALLSILRVRGEKPHHLAGFVRAMRRAAERVSHDEQVVLDTCGTGGDGAGLFNISTATALLVASAGVAVAKHGNRAQSGTCGSADVLEAMRIPFCGTSDEVAATLKEKRFAFLYAPAFHPAMRHAATARKELGFRTLFNFCGPLANPARPTHQLIGTPNREAMELVSTALAKLKVRRALVFTTANRIDELIPGHSFEAILVEGGDRLPLSGTAPTAGEGPLDLQTIQGSTARKNAQMIERLAQGEYMPPADAVAVNAGAAFWLVGQAQNLQEGYEMAGQLLATGRMAELIVSLRSSETTSAE